MDILRRAFDLSYDAVRESVFSRTAHDPEEAHELFVKACRVLHKTGLERLVLDHTSNRKIPYCEISNAAGFNKNAYIPPTTLKYMGFDRVVIGTVTYDYWEGNPRPRCKRFPETSSLVNWLGLPGIGAVAVADRLAGYGDHGVPLTVNIMSTPQKQGDDLLKDIEKTIKATRHLPYVDRFELNISCPNTHGISGKMDVREEYQAILHKMMKVCLDTMLPHQELWLKVSPDLDEQEVAETIAVTNGYRDHNLRKRTDKPFFVGYTCTNSTRKHDPEFISPSPGKGGASGPAVYSASTRVQSLFEYKGKGAKIIACGGINSLERARQRTQDKADGLQIYTALVFQGPRFIRRLRERRW